MQHKDTRHNQYDESFYNGNEVNLHTRDFNNFPQPSKMPVEKITPVLSLGFIVVIQLVGSVWWAATLDSRVENVTEQIKTTIAENYSNSQAEADKLNNQLQIDQIKADNKRIEDNLKSLQSKLENLYERFYSK